MFFKATHAQGVSGEEGNNNNNNVFDEDKRIIHTGPNPLHN